ncbi:MAG: hypothetical protein OXI64_12985 [Defluviicoccus sp.]|nr:hypothetical protein [Defluviicoccus sp.]
MHKSTRIVRVAAMALSALLISTESGAQSPTPPSAAALAAEIEALKQDYEARLKALESQLSSLKAETRGAASKPAAPARPAQDNAFNPAIGLVLDGRYASFSAEESSIPGFVIGHEAERAPEGLSLGHSEVTASGNIDDKFRGALTLGLGAHPGEPTEVELEEAYVQTLPGAGLLEGMRVKAGRALWTFGYLNEQHPHGDDFADRPLPYRAFLDNAFNDDGVEVSLVLPTEVYSEFGGGLFRGDDMPLFGGSDNGLRARSVYTRVGWDMGRDAAVRVGGYLLDGRSRGRGGGADAHAHEEEEDHAEEENGHDEEEEDHAAFFTEGAFTGDTRLYGLDFRFTLAPTGNARDSEVILQGEYFWRREKGTYALAEEMAHEEENGHEGEEEEEELGELRTDSVARGWYIQGVYKPAPSWRIGARYARLSPPDGSEIDHNPYAFGAMVDWTNSEFGRIRLQYNHENLDGREKDNQIMLQYVMSLGAHAAHSF